MQKKKPKRILFLGGAYSQLPAIVYAKERGHTVITVDYLPENPGHRLADAYYNISTLEKEAILRLSKKLNIDGIIAYCTDPAAPTAAYVSEKLNLVGNSYEVVELISNKIHLRNFMQEHGYRSPWHVEASTLEELKEKYAGDAKAILKPADSSGSKGVFQVHNWDEIARHFDAAIQFSSRKFVILEQFIERKGPLIHGEGIVEGGELKFVYFGEKEFSTVNGLIPFSTMMPGLQHRQFYARSRALVMKFLKEVGFKNGGFSTEIIRDPKDELWLLEIGARSGGNFMPQLIQQSTGFNLMKANVDLLTKEMIQYPMIDYMKSGVRHAQIILHATRNGIFKGIRIPSIFENKIKQQVLYYKQGDHLRKYSSSNDVVGVLIIELENEEDIESYYKALKNNQWVALEE